MQVTTVVAGLSNPWDLTWIEPSLMLYDLKAGQVWSKRGSAAPRQVAISGFPAIFNVGESGLLGIVADRASATNRRFYTCQAVQNANGGALDIRVLRWRMTSDTTATSDGAPVVTGIPLASGRHGGCRLRFGADGYLYVGTGDAAVGTNPQNLASLGGKVLRVGWDGSIPADNPFVAQGGNARYVYNYGHRNVQGLATRPGTNEVWSVEHGSDRDDEVNLVVRGANYGWDPVPGYNEATPMTDLAKFPSARPAMWTSGLPTVATSGAAFLSDARRGAWRGALAVALLKDQGISLMRMNPTPGPSRVVAVTPLAQAEGFGRIRTLMQGPDGALWSTTSNGTNDRIVRIAPTATPRVLPAGTLISTSGVTLARTGTQVTVFVRSTADHVSLRRSANDGSTWGGYAPAGVNTTNAPSATSSATGRVDLVTRLASGAVVHSWYRGGPRLGSTNLGGIVVAQHAVSLGDGTLDVFAVSPRGVAHRQHWNGQRWSGWVSLGGQFTSGQSASADPARKLIVVSGRTTDGATAERAVVQRGTLAIATTAVWTSAGDIVSRADGSFLIAGRGSDGGLWVNRGGPSSYSSVNLGGVVR